MLILLKVGDIFIMEHTEGWLRHGYFVYWMSKFVELMDTMYMILRHRTHQISFLHVWHHSSITLLAGEFGLFQLVCVRARSTLILSIKMNVMLSACYRLGIYKI